MALVGTILVPVVEEVQLPWVEPASHIVLGLSDGETPGRRSQEHIDTLEGVEECRQLATLNIHWMTRVESSQSHPPKGQMEVVEIALVQHDDVPSCA